MADRDSGDESRQPGGPAAVGAVARASKEDRERGHRDQDGRAVPEPRHTGRRCAPGTPGAGRVPESDARGRRGYPGPDADGAGEPGAARAGARRSCQHVTWRPGYWRFTQSAKYDRMFASERCQVSADPVDHQGLRSWMVSTSSATWTGSTSPKVSVLPSIQRTVEDKVA